MVRSLIILVVVWLFIQEHLKAQPQETAPNTYIVFLKYKKNSHYSLNNPVAFLSQKALARRLRQSITVDSSDLPVNAVYIDSLRRLGVQIQNVSRWFNSVTFKTSDKEVLNTLSELDFIEKFEKTTPLNLKLNNTQVISYHNSLIDSLSYGVAYRQIHIHNGEYLHEKGFKGENMLVAVIDAGFNNYKTLNCFQHVIAEGRIKGTEDFVDHDGDVNSDNAHGTNVFSIIGGEIENIFIGTAPKSDFLLLRSEDASYDLLGRQNEFLTEEDNWISAAEYADSLGTDVINTSLGYSTFNNPEQNHTYQDMNGESTRISKAAEIAVKKGMIVIVSAGNEGVNPWKYISAPADAENVLAVGAVNRDLLRAGFSSIGPSSDNRIKPDVMAMGWETFLQSPGNTTANGNGTSFAAPVITGLTACLWQGAKNKTNLEVINAIRRSSSLYETPNNNYGYGIPDFKKALLMLNPSIDKTSRLQVYPNPFSTQLTVFHEASGSNRLILEFYSTTGKIMYTKTFNITPDVSGEIEIPGISSIPKGVVIIKAIMGDKVLTTTAIKM